MNNTVTSVLSLVVRALIVALMGALSSHLSPTMYNLVNNIIIKLGGTETIVLYLVGFLGTVGAAVWLKLKSKLDLRNALASPRGSSLDEIKAVSATQNPLTTITNPAK